MVIPIPFFVSRIMAFLKSICRENFWKKSSPKRKGMLMGTTWLWNSMCFWFRRVRRAEMVPRNLWIPVPKLNVWWDRLSGENSWICWMYASYCCFLTRLAVSPVSKQYPWNVLFGLLSRYLVVSLCILLFFSSFLLRGICCILRSSEWCRVFM